jgi:hypothetical protein
MLIGYVSDEMYAAIAAAPVEFVSTERLGGDVPGFRSGVSRSRTGWNSVVLAATGFGSELMQIEWYQGSEPVQFRLLSSDEPLGYMWPKYARAGEAGELRLHNTKAVPRVAVATAGKGKGRRRRVVRTVRPRR